jgi:3'-phosphoadenosine 5'-phosphosulfate sulfotransferase (PAPS reductase)/FAD synthetase
LKEDYVTMLNWPLKRKVFHFYEVLDTFYHKLDGKVYLSFSGGKDSTVMKELAKRWCKAAGKPEIQAVFNNTTNEHKEILEFVRSHENVIELRPKMTFAQVLSKYGYPLISKDQSMAISRYKMTKDENQKKYRLSGKKTNGTIGRVGVISKKWQFVIDAPFDVTNRCCDILKKDPVKRYEKETGLRPIIGVMAEESNTRRVQYLKNGGCNVWTEGKEKCMPLSIFTEDDIWALIDKFNIEICSIYKDQVIDGELVKGEQRTGCAYCAFGCHLEDDNNNRFTRLYKRDKKRYLSFMDKLGYREALTYIGIKLPDQEYDNEQMDLFENLD